jgi:hypothetical protein
MPADAALIANHEASRVQVDDGAAHAVAETEPCVVSAAEELLADPVLALTQRHGFAAEPTVAEHERVCCLVEVVDVCTVVGEHHVAARAAACFPPPVGQQPLLRRGRVLVDRETAAPSGEGEVRLRVTVTRAGECLAFERVELAAVAGECDHVEPIAERVMEAAGADRGQLGRVANHEPFPLGPADGVEEGCEQRASRPSPASSTTSTQR